jgi:hypothetical protein
MLVKGMTLLTVAEKVVLKTIFPKPSLYAT